MSELPMLPRGTLPELPKPDYVPERVVRRWDQFLGEIASGVKMEEASVRNRISEADVETMTRLNPVEEKRWFEARQAGKKRAWSVFLVEKILDKIAGGMNVKEAITSENKDYAQFQSLILRDPNLREQYEKALEARASAMGEDLEALADDKTGDTLPGPKGGEIPNMANVNRSKLQVDTRRFLMGSWHAKMFGDAKNRVDVNVTVNHAQVLEDARARAKDRGQGRISREEMKKAIDATFSESPPVDADTSWMEDKPADTVWREES